MRYVAGLFDAVPMLRALVTGRTASSLELVDRRVVVEVHTCSFKTTRGYSFDVEFLTPSLLPPRTPMFRDINTLTFRQILRPTQ